MPIEGGLDYLNPSDIESIEVLKDAASGAIYGEVTLTPDVYKRQEKY